MLSKGIARLYQAKTYDLLGLALVNIILNPYELGLGIRMDYMTYLCLSIQVLFLRLDVMF